VVIPINPVESPSFPGSAYGRKSYNFESCRPMENNPVIPDGKYPRSGAGKASGARIHRGQDLAAFDASILFSEAFFHGQTNDSVFKPLYMGKSVKFPLEPEKANPEILS
jgi:hypothetical protein